MHYTNISSTSNIHPMYTNVSPISTFDVVHKNLFKITFKFPNISDEDMAILENQFVGIKKNKMKFNVNLTEKDKIIPLEVINRVRGKKGNITIDLHHMDGTTHNRIYIQGFQFGELCKHNFLDFDYRSTKLLDIKIKFVYDSYEVIGDKDIKMFTLNKKIKKIKCISSDSQQ